FSILIVARTLVALVLIRMLGNALARPIDSVLRFFDRWTMPATVASVAAVALYLLWEHLRRRRPEAERDVAEVQAGRSVAEVDSEGEGRVGGRRAGGDNAGGWG